MLGSDNQEYLIAGLGNVGEAFLNTRHSVGFRIINLLAKEYDATFMEARLTFYAAFTIERKRVHLIKPLTLVNDSGTAVFHWLTKLELRAAQLVVLVDDKDLPFGTIRIKPKGGDGRHNGLRSITEAIGTDNYARLRFGIGHDFEAGKQKEFVLGQWSIEERDRIENYLTRSVEALESYIIAGPQQTMTKYNTN